MKALTKLSSAADDVAVRSRPVPSPAAGQALVLVTATGLCGSDVHAIRGHAGYEWVSAPVTLGHEITGVVAAAPDRFPWTPRWVSSRWTAAGRATCARPAAARCAPTGR